MQWRIQDFPEGDTNPKDGAGVLTYSMANYFPKKTSMKIKKLDGVAWVPSPPISASGMYLWLSESMKAT